MSVQVRSRTTKVGAMGFAAVALGCAAFAAYLVNNMLNAKGFTGDRVRPVLIAKHNLPAAQPITPDDVEVVSWPEKHVPPGAATDAKAFFADNKHPVPTGAILEGEPVVSARLAASDEGTGIATLVRDGYRAVAVKVDESIGRSGLVYPGAFVDVMATIRDPDGRGPSTRIAVSDARVLAVESDADVATRRIRRQDPNNQEELNKPSYQGTVVTIEVAPADAEVVSLAASEGRVDLALRNGNDHKQVETAGAIPVAFSAFAPTVDPNAPAAPATAAPPAAAPAPTSKTTLASTRAKRIQLKAVDSSAERGEHASREIETYHAQ